MLQSGSREGEELRRVWCRLKVEEEQASTWLGEEVHDNFKVDVEGIGGTSSAMEALEAN